MAVENKSTDGDAPRQPDNSQDNKTVQRASAAARLLKPLRIWPAVALLGLLWALRIVPGMIEEQTMATMMLGFIGPAAAALLVLVWWLGFSRASWKERLLGLCGVVVIAMVTSTLADRSVQGFGILMFLIPWGITAFAGALICLGWMPSMRRTWVALLAAAIGFGYWDTVRSEGVYGDFADTRIWRWESTAEEKYLDQLPDVAVVAKLVDEPLAEPQWPAFRGPLRDSVQPDVVLAEDWEANPPEELWHTLIGPGWSSFSLAGKRLFTQEQRGENEVISCYHADDGSPLWVWQYPSRFWESMAGAGPRATPTLDNGRLFALGAEGLLHRLDPVTGEVVWQRDLKADAAREPPQWGFSSSPLVVDDVVIVHAGGAEDKGVLAYDCDSGDLLWSVAAGDHSYSSPHLADVAGRRCVLMLTNTGLTFIDPAEAKIIWEYAWPYQGYRVVQPLLVDANSLLLGTSVGGGTRRIDVRADGDGLRAEERWTSRRMKPAYNDYVMHGGYVYGFDQSIFGCIDVETGQRKWKRGRYDNGQVLLLPSADQLLVLSETGEIVLLRTNPDKLEELARLQVLEGKTWNHPVLVGDRLYVRNGREVACYVMPLGGAVKEVAQ